MSDPDQCCFQRSVRVTLILTNIVRSNIVLSNVFRTSDISLIFKEWFWSSGTDSTYFGHTLGKQAPILGYFSLRLSRSHWPGLKFDDNKQTAFLPQSMICKNCPIWSSFYSKQFFQWLTNGTRWKWREVGYWNKSRKSVLGKFRMY